MCLEHGTFRSCMHLIVTRFLSIPFVSRFPPPPPNSVCVWSVYVSCVGVWVCACVCVSQFVFVHVYVRVCCVPACV